MPSLAHRGRWSDPARRNSLDAFVGAFSRGHGAELDVRDLDGELVISHDPPRAGALRFDDVVSAYLLYGCPGALAVNVKADGLAEPIAAALADVPADRWFAFDMSVPDALLYARAGLPFFTRHSDVEPAPALYAQANGVWLDDFAGGFIEESHIRAHTAHGKRVAVVSPELHRRDHTSIWETWAQWPVWDGTTVMLCTDHPDHAQEVFA